MKLTLLEYVEQPIQKELSPYYIYLIQVQGQEVGRITLRLGTIAQHYYAGHIGYYIEKPYRGHHYAYHACMLLKEKLLELGYHEVIITCNPDNIASRKTIEKLSATYLETVNIPANIKHLFKTGETKKIIYIWRV